MDAKKETENILIVRVEKDCTFTENADLHSDTDVWQIDFCMCVQCGVILMLLIKSLNVQETAFYKTPQCTSFFLQAKSYGCKVLCKQLSW